MYNDVNLNDYGFYTLKVLPRDEERENYYRKKYYQDGMTSYQTHYTPQELTLFRAKLEQKYLLIQEHAASPTRSFLDVGCGEGFALSFFKQKGFSVTGLDYSSAGIENHNRDILNDVILGDIYNSMDILSGKGTRFDVINMDNILEHVTDPKSLLEQLYGLLRENGLIIIKVPNDFSTLQRYFLENRIISKPHWVVPLDHISYFNRDGLVAVCRAAGLINVDILGNYMTEFFALNPNTNYLENPEAGKSCHLARVAQENIFHSISPEMTLELYRVLGKMGLGREIIGVFKKAGGL